DTVTVEKSPMLCRESPHRGRYDCLLLRVRRQCSEELVFQLFGALIVSVESLGVSVAVRSIAFGCDFPVLLSDEIELLSSFSRLPLRAPLRDLLAVSSHLCPPYR